MRKKHFLTQRASPFRHQQPMRYFLVSFRRIWIHEFAWFVSFIAFPMMSLVSRIWPQEVYLRMQLLQYRHSWFRSRDCCALPLGTLSVKYIPSEYVMEYGQRVLPLSEQPTKGVVLHKAAALLVTWTSRHCNDSKCISAKHLSKIYSKIFALLGETWRCLSKGR